MSSPHWLLLFRWVETTNYHRKARLHEQISLENREQEARVMMSTILLGDGSPVIAIHGNQTVLLPYTLKGNIQFRKQRFKRKRKTGGSKGGTPADTCPF